MSHQAVDDVQALVSKVDAVSMTAMEQGDGDQAGEGDQPAASTTSKAKKKKSKPKAAVDPAQALVDQLSKPVESEDELRYWRHELRPYRETIYVPQFGLITHANFANQLELVRTPSCRSLTLTTPRLILRQVEPLDLGNMIRIKTEPVVQSTQLYGNPSSELHVREMFLNRYLRSSMPRIGTTQDSWVDSSSGRCKVDTIFAITLRDPDRTTLGVGNRLRMDNRIRSAEGYVGNIAVSLTCSPTANLLPKAKKVYTQPTLDQTASAELKGTLFYEIHPQLWGQGFMKEAFSEVLRFAFEEIGCKEVAADPTKGNEASIKLCTQNGMKYSHSTKDNPYQKVQLFHKIPRKDWFERNRSGAEMKGKHNKDLVCRWCLIPHDTPPIYRCTGCNWALYCSRECQRADWVRQNGHQSECDKKSA